MHPLHTRKTCVIPCRHDLPHRPPVFLVLRLSDAAGGGLVATVLTTRHHSKKGRQPPLAAFFFGREWPPQETTVNPSTDDLRIRTITPLSAPAEVMRDCAA